MGDMNFLAAHAQDPGHLSPITYHAMMDQRTVGRLIMKIVRLLLLLSGLAFAPYVVGADGTLGDRLVGVWREYSPSSNIVRFEKDGSTKLYLKKGEIGDLRTLD